VHRYHARNVTGDVLGMFAGYLVYHRTGKGDHTMKRYYRNFGVDKRQGCTQGSPYIVPYLAVHRERFVLVLRE
jgi:hypothetical protein